MADLVVARRKAIVAPIVAAAQVIAPSRNLRIVKYDWQTQLWNYYREGIGAFKYAMLWHTQTMSRVRLVAALQKQTGEPPEPLTSGPAVDAMAQFYGGPAGQSQYMSDIDLQLQMPGEGFVIGKPNDSDGYEWCVKSTAEVDTTSGRGTSGKTVDLWRIQVDESTYETLPEDSYVFRQWLPDHEKHWRPDSPARGALPTLRLIDMLERRLMSQAVSRLAMNGFLKYAQEITFPVNPKFKDEPDPFIAELLDIAERVIGDPSSALAAMPLPIKIPNEYFDKFEHVQFSNPYDERVGELLDRLYDKLSVALNMPKEVVTGMGSTSHWNAWSLDEIGIKTHIKPPAEAICQGLTKAYLHPWLAAAGQPSRTSEGELVVWYSTEELDIPADRSAAADSAVDRVTISPTAYRSAKGFNESDKPTAQETRDMLLIQASKLDPSLTPTVIKILTGLDVEFPAPPAAPAPPDVTPPAEQPPTGKEVPTDQPPAPTPTRIAAGG